MAHTNLRVAVLRLAARRADLRPHLLPLLNPQVAPTPAAAPQVAAPPVQAAPQPVIYQPAAPPPPIIIQPTPAPAPQQAPIIVMPGMVPSTPAPPPPPPPAQVTVAPQVTVSPTAPAAPTFTAPPPTTLTDFGTGVFVTSRTQHGFDVDLAPEMTRMLQLGMTKEQVADWAKLRVREAFRVKDALYMILIRYQSTFENDEHFRLSLERAIDIWRVIEGNTAPPGV